jgi:hypothetical protein
MAPSQATGPPRCEPPRSPCAGRIDAAMYNLPHTGFGSAVLAVVALLQTGIGALLARLGRRR